MAGDSTQSPIVDLFRRGEVPRDVRELGARGALELRTYDQLVVLVHLTNDQDAKIRHLATATLDGIPREPLQGFLARSDTSEHLRAFFRSRGVEPGASPASDDSASLVRGGDEDEGQDASTTRPQQINLLPVMDRLKLVMKGTREQRAALIRDPNKMVSLGVLGSPKLTDTEIEGFARMANVSEEVLRVIGTTRAWLKKYSVIAALARNPKTPPAVSLTLVNRLNERDVKSLSVDRNVSEPLRTAARKILIKGAARRR